YPRLARPDRATVHRGGEPAPARLGRGDRGHRGRRVLLGPRRPGPADHHPARPAARRRFARGPGAAVRGSRGDDGGEGPAVVNVDVTMPQLGETVAEGTVTRWLRRVGDA